jgi:hypothetical protein
MAWMKSPKLQALIWYHWKHPRQQFYPRPQSLPRQQLHTRNHSRWSNPIFPNSHCITKTEGLTSTDEWCNNFVS